MTSSVPVALTIRPPSTARAPATSRRRRLSDDTGSAVAEFVFVSVLLTALTLAVLQLALALHIRNTLIDAAAEGARFAALADNGLSDGEARTRQLVTSAVGESYAGGVRAAETEIAGYPTITVTVVAPLPLAGLLGAPQALEVSGRAAVERDEGRRETPGGARRSCSRLRAGPRAWRDEQGSASLEFVSVGMLLLVPLVYLILVLSSLQGASLAAEGAARQGARLFAQAPDEETGRARLHRAVVLGLDDFGFSEADGRVDVRCAPQAVSCLRRGGTVTVDIRIAVALPFVPHLIRSVGVGTIPVVASATSPVSRLRVGE